MKSVAWSDSLGTTVTEKINEGEYKSEEKKQISTLTASPKSDTTYTCQATFDNEETTGALSIAMNVFCKYHSLS